MIQKILFIVVCVPVCAGVVEAQIKRQAAVGVSAVAPRLETVTPATTVHGGFALIVPVAKRLFVRPVVTVALVNPTPEGKKNFFSVSGVGLVGFKVNPAFTVLAGGGITFNFPTGQPVTRLPTLAVSSATKINAQWAIFTPLTVTSKSIGIATQLGLTW